MSVLVDKDMEQDGAMNRCEYHECMSKVYLTQAMMFAIVAAFMYRDYGLCPAFTCSIFVAIAGAVRTIMHTMMLNG